MSVSVTMPRLGESVTEGTVTRWLKKEGDTVSADEPLLEVSTDKVDTEVPSPASGTLLAIKVAEDETVEIGVELAIIGDPSEASSGGGTPADPPVQEAAQPQAAQPETVQPAATQAAAAQPAAPEQAAPAPAPAQPAPAAEPAPVPAAQAAPPAPAAPQPA